ncbi:structural cement protein Gp24 [Pseudomonas aeruginosa]
MPVIGGNAINHGAAYAGMVADGELSNAVSKLNKGTANIPFGLGVVSDGDDGAKLPTSASTAAQFIGVVKRELNRAYQANEAFGAVAKRDMSVETVAPIWVTARVDVAKDDPVYLVVGDGTGTNQGQFSNVVGAAATLAVLIPNAKWVSSASAGALAKISLKVGG